MVRGARGETLLGNLNNTVEEKKRRRGQNKQINLNNKLQERARVKIIEFK